jgi:biopolymer transport protein ExbD
VGKKLKLDEMELNMTPMIDVVFQLIIFFVVTLKMEDEFNKEIHLEKGPHGPAIKSEGQSSTLVIEVDSKGRLSMHGLRIDRNLLTGMLHRRYNKVGEFPVLIRADKKTKHQDVRAVMDLCTSVGLWKINFAAVKQEAGKAR